MPCAVDGAGALISKARATLVKQPLYANAYNFTSVIYSHVTSWPIVRAPLGAAHTYIYPAFKPVVGPFVDRLSPHFKNVQKSLKPQAEPVPVQEATMKQVDAAKTQARPCLSRPFAACGLMGVNVTAFCMPCLWRFWAAAARHSQYAGAIASVP